MSRGPGKMQTLIVDALRLSAAPMTAVDLRDRYAFEIWDPDSDPEFEIWNTAERRRSIRMSMGRALRQLEATGEIKRNDEGAWYPVRDWAARDEAERNRAATAHHEAGHAVIGLALKLPVAFVTIKPKGSTLGHVNEAPVHHSVGPVYARGSYYKPIADMSEQDAFGNPVSKRNKDWHADIVMTIAGGMAEAEFKKDGRTWRELEGTGGDKRCIAFARRKLGDRAGSIEEL